MSDENEEEIDGEIIEIEVVDIYGYASVLSDIEPTIVKGKKLKFSGQAIVTGESIEKKSFSLSLSGTASIVASSIFPNSDARESLILLELQPGESIIFDSERYYVFKNNKNITEVHDGKWIDELDRKTTKISVKTDASTFLAEITYTERYL